MKGDENMNFPLRLLVDDVRARYPVGTRVSLIYMNDPYTKLEPGTQGTVEFVDDMATVHVRWDNGSRLGVVYNEDRIARA